MSGHHLQYNIGYRIGWVEMEPAPAQDENGTTFSIPGGGIARDLLLACNAANISILALVLFASDGDNTPESMALLRNANRLYQFVPSDDSTRGEAKFRIPSSWEYFSGGSEPAPIF